MRSTKTSSGVHRFPAGQGRNGVSRAQSWRAGGSLLNHTWMMRQLPQDKSASALTTHQLQMERRESHRANSVEGDY